MCEVVKEVGIFYRPHMRKPQAIKSSKLQMLTASFEDIRMKYAETFNDFYANLNDTL